MPVLNPDYRVNLLDMRTINGFVILERNNPDGAGEWGFRFGPDTAFLGTHAADAGLASSASGVVPFTMPANYIAGSAFTVRLGLNTNSLEDPLAGSFVKVGLQKIAVNQFDDPATVLLNYNASSQPMTLGAYTQYDFAITAEQAADLAPADLLNIRIGVNLVPATDNGTDYVFFSNAFLLLDPA